MSSLRQRKVAGTIKSELSLILDRKVRDPRKTMITITEVRLNHDMSVATVFFTTMGDQQEKKEALQLLEHAKAFLRTQLSPVLKLRKMPELKFEIDNSFEYGNKIDSLLDKIKEKNGTKNSQEDE